MVHQILHQVIHHSTAAGDLPGTEQSDATGIESGTKPGTVPGAHIPALCAEVLHPGECELPEVAVLHPAGGEGHGDGVLNSVDCTW